MGKYIANILRAYILGLILKIMELMKRKLYALFILVWSLGALLLAYLYFFIYYTGTLTINSNVWDYRVELFSPGTAQKWVHECPDPICEIYNVSPFDYNLSIIKTDYKTKVLSFSARPRGVETLVVQLEKQVKIESISRESVSETPSEKIQRIRDENLYYAKFTIDESVLRFKDEEAEILLQYVFNQEVKDIWKFKKVEKSEIDIAEIYSSKNILLKLWNDNYIFDTSYFRLQKLPEIKNLRYVKYDSQNWKYIAITQVWAFIYNIEANSLQYEYQFKDYISLPWFIIGIIYSNETQKKENFNILEKGNVIIKYSQADKTRKVIYSTNDPIDEIYQKWDQIYIVSWNNLWELKNFD